MKIQKVKLTICLAIFSLLLLSCSKGVQKSPLQIEAEQQAKQWFNSSFAECNETYAAKYKGRPLAFSGSITTMREGFIQLKNTAYLVKEDELTESDKLNDIEWKGSLFFVPVKPPFRYFKLDAEFNSLKKWSEWMEEALIYEPNRYDFLKPKDASKSPLLRNFKKVKGEWKGLSELDFNRIECSELPPG